MTSSRLREASISSNKAPSSVVYESLKISDEINYGLATQILICRKLLEVRGLIFLAVPIESDGIRSR